MRKVLVLTTHDEDRDFLEGILGDKVDELLFAKRKEQGRALLKEHHPQLFFLDNALAEGDEESWIHEGCLTVLMTPHKRESHTIKETLSRPLHKQKVLALTEQVFGGQGPSLGNPPM